MQRVEEKEAIIYCYIFIGTMDRSERSERARAQATRSQRSFMCLSINLLL